MITLKEKLKGLREDKDMTQKELGKILNVANTTISSWELGATEPSIQHLKALSKIYDVSIDYLTGNELSDDVEFEYIIKSISSDIKLKHLMYILAKEFNKIK